MWQIGNFFNWHAVIYTKGIVTNLKFKRLIYIIALFMWVAFWLYSIQRKIFFFVFYTYSNKKFLFCVESHKSWESCSHV